MITIKNLRTEKFDNTKEYNVRVDRASVLGNPFRMSCEAQRDEVCNMYEEYFKNMMKTNMQFLNEVRRLYKLHKQYGQLNLYCWCAPKRCHAETIKKFLEQYI